MVINVYKKKYIPSNLTQRYITTTTRVIRSFKGGERIKVCLKEVPFVHYRCIKKHSTTKYYLQTDRTVQLIVFSLPP